MTTTRFPTRDVITVVFCLLLLFLVAGCVSTASYQIISNQEGPSQTKIDVEVPAISTQGDMQMWANHLEAIYKRKGKTMIIDFYCARGGSDQLIGTYRGDSVHPVRR